MPLGIRASHGGTPPGAPSLSSARLRCDLVLLLARAELGLGVPAPEAAVLGSFAPLPAPLRYRPALDGGGRCWWQCRVPPPGGGE
jgi:hypothetical protein